MYCKKCGSILEDTDTVCKNCGEPVGNAPVGSDKTTSEAGSSAGSASTDSGTAADSTVKTVETPVETTETPTEIGKAPGDDFKWNIDDFPKDENEKPGDIKFDWGESDVSKKDSDTFNEKSEKFRSFVDDEYKKFQTRAGIKDLTGSAIDDNDKKDAAVGAPDIAGMGLFGSDNASPFAEGKAGNEEVDSKTENKTEDTAVSEEGSKEKKEEPAMTWTETRPYKPLRKPEVPGDAAKKTDPLDPLDVSLKDEKKKETENDGEEDYVPKYTPKDVNTTKEPVVFPFEMDDEDGDDKKKEPGDPADQTDSTDSGDQSVADESADPASQVTANNIDRAFMEIPDDDFEDDPPKRKGLKIFVIILVILIVICGGALGVAKLAPDSAPGKWLNGLFSTGEETGEPEGGALDFIEPFDDKDTLISSVLFNNINIEDITVDESLVFDPDFSYNPETINSSVPIENDYWKLDENGSPMLYDQSALGAVIAFCSDWVTYVNEGDEEIFDVILAGSEAEKSARDYDKVNKIKITFKLLEVGEIRQNGDRVYIWVRETLSVEENGSVSDVSYTRVYCTEPDGDVYKITDY